MPSPLAVLVGLELQFRVDARRDVERVELRVDIVQGLVSGAVLDPVHVGVDVDVAVPVRELEGPVDAATVRREGIGVLVVRGLRVDGPVELVVHSRLQVGEVPVHLVVAQLEGTVGQLPRAVAVPLHQLEQRLARTG